MPVLVTADFPFIHAELYKKTHRLMMNNGRPEGFIAHACLKKGKGISVADIWESREHFENFARGKIGFTMEKLGLAGGPENVVITELINADAFEYSGGVL